jgi:hypothetical protein
MLQWSCLSDSIWLSVVMPYQATTKIFSFHNVKCRFPVGALRSMLAEITDASHITLIPFAWVVGDSIKYVTLLCAHQMGVAMPVWPLRLLSWLHDRWPELSRNSLWV